jgi:hypothetical protein
MGSNTRSYGCGAAFQFTRDSCKVSVISFFVHAVGLWHGMNAKFRIDRVFLCVLSIQGPHHRSHRYKQEGSGKLCSFKS